MKTNTLLAAAAILAVGGIAAQAQVYSQNIVGYVNQVIPAGYTVVGNPLTTGSSNGVNEVFSALPDGTSFLFWNGSGFDTVIYDSSIGGFPWFDGGYNTLSAVPQIAPGTAFFINPPNAFTNTYVGTVSPAAGATNSFPLPAGYSLVSSVLPVGGAITNAALSFPLDGNDGISFLLWNGSGYVTRIYDTTVGDGNGPWYDGNYAGPVDAPVLNVGYGFFVNPPSATVWKQTLSNQ